MGGSLSLIVQKSHMLDMHSLGSEVLPTPPWGRGLHRSFQLAALLMLLCLEAPGCPFTVPAFSRCFSLWASLTSWPSSGSWSWPAPRSPFTSTSTPGPHATPSLTPARPRPALATCAQMPGCMVSDSCLLPSYGKPFLGDSGRQSVPPPVRGHVTKGHLSITQVAGAMGSPGLCVPAPPFLMLVS